jgi:hypothetical protein
VCAPARQSTVARYGTFSRPPRALWHVLQTVPSEPTAGLKLVPPSDSGLQQVRNVSERLWTSGATAGCERYTSGMSDVTRLLDAAAAGDRKGLIERVISG